MHKDVMNPLHKIYLVMFILLAGLLFVPAGMTTEYMAWRQ